MTFNFAICHHYSELMYQVVFIQTRTGKIPAGVPSYVTTANKTGELDDTENDAAIIYLVFFPKRIAICSNKGVYTMR